MAKQKFDPAQYSFAELQELSNEIAQAVKDARDTARAKAKSDTLDFIANTGFSFSELFGAGPASDTAGKRTYKKRGEADSEETKTSAAPKYRHPENPELTWTGRGRKPAWVITHLEGGKALDDLLIS